MSARYRKKHSICKSLLEILLEILRNFIPGIPSWGFPKGWWACQLPRQCGAPMRQQHKQLMIRSVLQFGAASPHFNLRNSKYFYFHMSNEFTHIFSSFTFYYHYFGFALVKYALWINHPQSVLLLYMGLGLLHHPRTNDQIVRGQPDQIPPRS